jgi:hypothetical protein
LPYYPFLSENLPLREFRAHFGRDDCARELDRAQELVLRLVADRHLHEIAIVAKDAQFALGSKPLAGFDRGRVKT